MKLLKVIENGTCEFCNKEKEVCEIETDTGRKSVLCFRDLQKLARLNLKEPEKAKV